MKRDILYNALLIGLALWPLINGSVHEEKQIGAENHEIAEQKMVATAPKISFKKDIQPILQSQCMPCHFEGGKMYDRLPFDTATTIYQLGEKLFTRIEAHDDQQKIRNFISQTKEKAY
ncbi:MAG: hypothetical protein R3345_02870 [Fulvivirga sp.]|nr:hypothetical protein [Fulvivirga sp.]